MKILSFPGVGRAAVLAISLTFAAESFAAVVIGNTTTDRGTTDSFSGQIFMLNAGLNSLVGQQLGSWSFFNNNNTNAVTPLLLEDMGGGSFAIRGIGSTIVGNASGVQGGPFSLVSGTAIIGPNYFAGYYDGSWNGVSAIPNPGGVEFNSVDDPGVPGQIDSLGTLWTHVVPDCTDNPANIGIGVLNSRDTVHGPAVDGRHYSVNFTAIPIPEPAATGLAALAGLALIRRRR